MFVLIMMSQPPLTVDLIALLSQDKGTKILGLMTDQNGLIIKMLKRRLTVRLNFNLNVTGSLNEHLKDSNK